MKCFFERAAILVLVSLGASACPAPTVLSPEGPVLDLHTHCRLDSCQPEAVADLLDGNLFIASLSLEHYAIANALGDAVPDEVQFITENNTRVQEAADADHVLLMPSLECLYDTPASDPLWVEACLADADRWIAAGAVGFKDHAGKAWDGDDVDLARWVGAFNRRAGYCTVADGDPNPNAACQRQATSQMPLDHEGWRAMVRGLVEDREVALVTHAVSWRGADTECGRRGEVMNCYDAGAEALVDFALWAAANLSEAARRRIVVAHVGFMDEDQDRLIAILDAGLSVDLAQTALSQTGCDLRNVVAAYPEQIVIGTDIETGQADCAEAHYAAWLWALLGEGDVSETHPGTCRGEMSPRGAALGDPDACGITVPDDAARRVLYDNAAALVGDVAGAL